MENKSLPQNWKIKPMPEVVKWGSGGTPKATERSYYENGTIPWLIIGDLNDGIVTKSQSKITELGLANSSAKLIPSGTLMVAMYGSIGKLGISGMECCTNQAIAFAKELYNVIPKYMFYYMAFVKPTLISMGKGGTQKNISQTVLRSLNVIVPPIEEQQYIVSRIKELFSELDKGVETLQTIKEQLTVYRQAVLKEEFDRAGENKSELEEIIEKPRYGTSKKCSSDAEEMAIPVYRIPNINYSQGIISHNDLKYASFAEDELSALKLKVGDILIIRSNGSVSLVGRTAVVSKRDIGGLFAGYLMRLRIKVEKKVLPQYLNLYLNTHYARNQIEMMAKSTSGVNNINATEICQIKIPICDIDLQKEIIEAIESKLSLCDSIEQTVDTALAQAEAMRQSILKKAFEGELCK